MTLDGYNETYDEAEIGEASIDLIVEVFTDMIPFATIIVIALLWKLFRRNK